MQKIPLCLNCNKYPSIIDPRLGVLVCKQCRQKQTTGLKRQIEFTTDEIKNQRKEHKNDIVQPWREGRLSKEYLQQHGTKGIKVTPEEIKQASNIWGIDEYYKD